MLVYLIATLTPQKLTKPEFIIYEINATNENIVKKYLKYHTQTWCLSKNHI